MLRQHIHGAFEQRRYILCTLSAGFKSRPAFQDLEPVCGHKDRPAGFVHAVVGVANSLRQPAGTLWSANINDHIDITPVDTEVEC